MELIKEWTTNMRYKPYHLWSIDYQNILESKLEQSKWKLAFHIQPKSGLLNDPNGFSFYDGKWHLFYQAYPFGPVHGVKSWFHMTSHNLVDWKQNDYALLPDSPYDSHGVYSGSDRKSTRLNSSHVAISYAVFCLKKKKKKKIATQHRQRRTTTVNA